MKNRIQSTVSILAMMSILVCAFTTEAQEELATVSLEQALSVPAAQLAEGYVVVKGMIPLAKLAQHGATVKRSLDDPEDLINSKNANIYLKALEERLAVYEQAIRQRGFMRLARAYSGEADEPCSKLGVGSVPTLCEQSDFHITISQGQYIHHGVIVESEVVVEHAGNSEIHLLGKATPDQIVFNARISGFSAKMYPVSCRVVLKKADQNNSSFARAYFGRARGHLQRNETDKSLTDIAEALGIDPDFAPAYALRSQSFSKSDDERFRNGERALEDATTACDLTKWENWEYLHPLAAAYAENGDFGSAIRLVNEAIKSAPAEEREELEEELERYRQNKPYRFEFQRTDPDFDSSDPPTDASGWFDRGKMKFDAGDFRQCIPDFTEAIRLNQAIPSAYYHRGTAWRKIGEAENAINDFSEAIRIDATYAAAYIGRAQALGMKGDQKGAIEDFSHAIRLQPKNTFAIRSRAHALQSIGENDRAIQDLDQAILLNPKSAWSHRRRGDLWLNKKEFERAIKDFEVAIALDSKNAWVHNQLAWLLATCSDPKFRDAPRAIELAEKACALSEYEYRKVDTLAAAYAADGQFDQAIRWQERAIELAPISAKEDYRMRLRLYKSGMSYYEN